MNRDEVKAIESKTFLSHMLRFIPLPLINLVLMDGDGGVGDLNGTHLLLYTFSPNYYRLTASCRLSTMLLFTKHQEYLQTHFNDVKVSSVDNCCMLAPDN